MIIKFDKNNDALEFGLKQLFFYSEIGANNEKNNKQRKKKTN
jgi:hypothetical protein